MTTCLGFPSLNDEEVREAWRQARSYTNSGPNYDLDKAIEEYDKVLMKFPNHKLAADIKKSRELVVEKRGAELKEKAKEAERIAGERQKTQQYPEIIPGTPHEVTFQARGTQQFRVTVPSGKLTAYIEIGGRNSGSGSAEITLSIYNEIGKQLASRGTSFGNYPRIETSVSAGTYGIHVTRNVGGNCTLYIETGETQALAQAQKKREAEQLSVAQKKISLIDKTAINNPSSYETYAKSIVALKSEMEYSSQIDLLKEELDSTGNDLIRRYNLGIWSVREKYPEFTILGKVRNYLQGTQFTTFDIWGTALPYPQTQTTYQSLGTRQQENNLVVIVSNSRINTGTITWREDQILIQGKVYYSSLSSGTNAYGASVPVYNYTEDITKIPGFGSDGRSLLTVNTQIDEVRRLNQEYRKMLN